jgi:hypothetical protein
MISCQKPKIGILNHFFFNNSSLYTSWINEVDAEFYPYEKYDVNWLPTEKLDLLITHLHYHAPESSILINAVSKEIPTLVLADGILEYRNTWHKPSIPPASIFQPVLGHKVATIGRSQARFLESWGNLGKCEVVGLPRLDEYIGRKPRERKAGETFRVLITTAKTPGFTPGQIDAVQESLKDLLNWFLSFPEIEGKKIQPVWRLTEGLSEKLGINNHNSIIGSGDLASLLASVDAMITTPSTVMLEGMLQGIPVALLDYNNCPHFVPAAWEVTASQHIGKTMSQLLDPPNSRMLYQDTILHDSLECRSPAKQRMINLVNEMVEISRKCKTLNRSLEFPDRILKDSSLDHHLPEEKFDLKRLYPNHSVFSQMDRSLLQVENGHLKLEIEKLKNELQVSREKARFAEKQLKNIKSTYAWRFYKTIPIVRNFFS